MASGRELAYVITRSTSDKTVVQVELQDTFLEWHATNAAFVPGLPGIGGVPSDFHPFQFASVTPFFAAALDDGGTRFIAPALHVLRKLISIIIKHCPS